MCGIFYFSPFDGLTVVKKMGPSSRQRKSTNGWRCSSKTMPGFKTYASHIKPPERIQNWTLLEWALPHQRESRCKAPPLSQSPPPLLHLSLKTKSDNTNAGKCCTSVCVYNKDEAHTHTRLSSNYLYPPPPSCCWADAKPRSHDLWKFILVESDGMERPASLWPGRSMCSSSGGKLKVF